MVNQLRQVFRTYYTRWPFWLSLGFFLFMQAISTSSSGCWPSVPEPSRQSLRLGMMFGAPMLANIVVAMVLAAHLKLQFANPRSRLAPRFAAAHLLVAGLILFAVVGVQSWHFLDAYWGPFAWDITAYAILVLAVSAWFSYLARPWHGFLWFVLLQFIVGYMAPHVAKLAIAGNTMVFSGMAGLGLALLAVLGAWIAKPREITTNAPILLSSLLSREGLRTRQQIEAKQVASSRIRTRWFDFQFRWGFRWQTTAGPLRRIVLRQVAGGFSVLGFGLFQVVYCAILFGLIHWIDPNRPLGAGSIAFNFSFFVFYFTICMFTGIWVRRWSYLAHESLYPIGRGDFVWDIQKTIAGEMAVTCISFCAGLFIGLALYCPQGPLTENIVPFLAMIVAQYLVAAGILFWMISFRRVWLTFLGMVIYGILWSIAIYNTVFVWEGFWTPNHTVLVLVAVVSSTALLHHIASRRWMRIDLA
jgi:hypothetical protein